ncbi:DgyrCDS6533 [Dimorphilus gyrociliatus]|uniref:DgyrCDS6533 n=1 Tax=Dimorphilus gyrociliatus TaxID=2664684 RepID=A0A7I8VNB5_9ANNE|nr:DgyrCDS6533 [Dimorphilus gyrociliatus]
MVRLNIDMIARGTSGYTKKKREESMNQYLRRLTHLYLENRSIDEVGDDLSLCRNLIVLYLYDNRLPAVPHLLQNPNLTHLYLQNNQIQRIENLIGLNKLTKLYFGGNSITVVEGLEKLENLQELHIENQKLQRGEKLLFDPRSIVAISLTLQVLNVSANYLTSIIDLECLKGLTQFFAADNYLSDFQELAHCLNSWRNLSRLDLLGNPLCHKSKYRDRIIVLCNNLELLDGKEITPLSRSFIKNWQASKDKKRLSDYKKRNVFSETAVRTNDGDLPPISYQRHQSVPGFMMPALPRTKFQEILARSNSQPVSRTRLKSEENQMAYTPSEQFNFNSRQVGTPASATHDVQIDA